MYNMALIFETSHFTVIAPERPHVTRTDGGHVIIVPKEKVVDRTQLEPLLAIELAWLTMLMGEAMAKGFRDQGIDIGRINYQDNGNWGLRTPEGTSLHIHLYGRAKSAVTQPFGEALYFPLPETGFYDTCEPVSAADIASIQSHLQRLIATEKYNFHTWTV
jgi:diadenosine tetraphosphate (Ap4A) HIT family hydrolase